MQSTEMDSWMSWFSDMTACSEFVAIVEGDTKGRAL